MSEVFLSSRLVKYLFLAIAAFCLFLFLSTGSSFAQSPSPGTSSAEEVTFPIEDLGGCEDMGGCIKYCDDPVNNIKCVEYAKEKGFYRDDKVNAADEKFLEAAKEKLGCDSVGACMEVCESSENHDKCDVFAKELNIQGGYIQDPTELEFIDKAKEALGCGDAASCATFCDEPANQQKCTDFANDAGLLGGSELVGPDGCRSTATCGPVCRDPSNFGECGTYAPEGQSFKGPGGCASEGFCREYCEQNAEECRSYAPGSNGRYVPITCPDGEIFGPGGVCTPTDKTAEADACVGAGKYWSGSECKDDAPSGIYAKVPSAYFQPREDMGGCNTPGGCYDWCSENAGKCGGFRADAERPSDRYTPYVYYTPGSEVKIESRPDQGNCDSPGKCYDWCRENAGKCQGFDEKAPRPVDVYAPQIYFTPPTNYSYFTPPVSNFYVTPVYYTPPAGSNYSTPTYYTPGMYSTPSYYTPPSNWNYSTPTYYTPGSNYYTPSGQYPTPTYPTPRYYTPPELANYSTPSYYTPAQYTTPTYYTPPAGSSYTTPSYNTPAAYTSPAYYSPTCYNCQYTTPTYYTPPAGSSYTTPSYVTPGYSYPSPGGTYSYPTPSTYTYPSPTAASYTYPTPGSGGYYYPSPSGSSGYTYPTPTSSGYYSPYGYPTPGSSYNYPSPAGTYYYPTPSSSGGYGYPTPFSGGYPTPGYVYPSPSGTGTDYYTPNSSYTYPSPTDGTVPSYSYPTPSSYSYPSPTYGTPSYPTPAYNTPTYDTPTYNTPSYATPEYSTPSTSGGRVAGVATGPVQTVINFVKSLFR